MTAPSTRWALLLLLVTSGCRQPLVLDDSEAVDASIDASTGDRSDRPARYEPPLARPPQQLDSRPWKPPIGRAVAVTRVDSATQVLHAPGSLWAITLREDDGAEESRRIAVLGFDSRERAWFDAGGAHAIWSAESGPGRLRLLEEIMVSREVSGLDPRVASTGAHLAMSGYGTVLFSTEWRADPTEHGVDLIPGTHDIDAWLLAYRVREGDGEGAVVGRLREADWSAPMRFADAPAVRGSRIAIASWHGGGLLVWTEARNPDGSAGTEAVRALSVPDGGAPATLLEWPIEATDPVAKATGIALGSSYGQGYVVVGGRELAPGGGESLLLRVNGSSTPETLGPLPSVFGPRGVPWPCRPLDMVGYRMAGTDRLVVLCDGGRGEASQLVRVTVDDTGIVEAEVQPVGRFGKGPRHPRIACGPDECLVTWRGADYHAAKVRRSAPTEVVDWRLARHGATAPAAPLAAGSSFVVVTNREIQPVGGETAATTLAPWLGERDEPPAVTPTTDGWLAAVAATPTGVRILRGRGTGVAEVGRIASLQACRDVRLARGPRGGYLVVWTQLPVEWCRPEACDRRGDVVRATVLDSDGAPESPVRPLGWGYSPAVAASNRGYLVAWTSEAGDDVVVRRALLDAESGAVLRDASMYPEVPGARPALIPWNGAFYLAWARGDSVWGRRLDAFGSRMDGPASAPGFELGAGAEVALAGLDGRRLLVVTAGAQVTWRVVKYPEALR